MELTLELSQNKWPPADTLGDLFDANLPALLALPAAALFGGIRRAMRRVRVCTDVHNLRLRDGSGLQHARQLLKGQRPMYDRTWL